MIGAGLCLTRTATPANASPASARTSQKRSDPVRATTAVAEPVGRTASRGGPPTTRVDRRTGSAWSGSGRTRAGSDTAIANEEGLSRSGRALGRASRSVSVKALDPRCGRATPSARCLGGAVASEAGADACARCATTGALDALTSCRLGAGAAELGAGDSARRDGDVAGSEGIAGVSATGGAAGAAGGADGAGSAAGSITGSAGARGAGMGAAAGTDGDTRAGSRPSGST
jgi:hypothetical protein